MSVPLTTSNPSTQTLLLVGIRGCELVPNDPLPSQGSPVLGWIKTKRSVQQELWNREKESSTGLAHVYGLHLRCNIAAHPCTGTQLAPRRPRVLLLVSVRADLIYINQHITHFRALQPDSCYMSTLLGTVRQ